MNLLKKIFFKKKEQKLEGSETVVTNKYSQIHALKHHMRNANIRHGEIVEADLKGVRFRKARIGDDMLLEDSEIGLITAFFCPLDSVKVTQRLSSSDHYALPDELKLHNFNVPKDFSMGVYDIKNVLIHANGAINIMATKHTTLEKIE